MPPSVHVFKVLSLLFLDGNHEALSVFAYISDAPFLNTVINQKLAALTHARRKLLHSYIALKGMRRYYLTANANELLCEDNRVLQLLAQYVPDCTKFLSDTTTWTEPTMLALLASQDSLRNLGHQIALIEQQTKLAFWFNQDSSPMWVPFQFGKAITRIPENSTVRVQVCLFSQCPFAVELTKLALRLMHDGTHEILAYSKDVVLLDAVSTSVFFDVSVSSAGHYKVDSLFLSMNGVNGYVPLSFPGLRLCSTRAERVSRLYAPNARLCFDVAECPDLWWINEALPEAVTSGQLVPFSISNPNCCPSLEKLRRLSDRTYAVCFRSPGLHQASIGNTCVYFRVDPPTLSIVECTPHRVDIRSSADLQIDHLSISINCMGEYTTASLPLLLLKGELASFPLYRLSTNTCSRTGVDEACTVVMLTDSSSIAYEFIVKPSSPRTEASE